jgi:hypothetical protein
MNEREVYAFYTDRVKPIYSWIEAKDNTLPIELLFEIHAAFDHLKRLHLGEDKEENACNKAISHLKRGVLDAFKLKLKYFNNDFKIIIGGNAEYLHIIDNGEFLKGLYGAKSGGVWHLRPIV